MGDAPHDFGSTALAADALVHRNDDLITGVYELLGLETKRVERLHIRVEQLLDAFLAVVGLPVRRAFAVADLKIGRKTLEDGLDTTLIERPVGATKPLDIFLEHFEKRYPTAELPEESNRKPTPGFEPGTPSLRGTKGEEKGGHERARLGQVCPAKPALSLSGSAPAVTARGRTDVSVLCPRVGEVVTR
jgi:hypothetical protein